MRHYSCNANTVLCKDRISGEDSLESSVYGNDFSADVVRGWAGEEDYRAHQIFYVAPLSVGAQRHAFADLVKDSRVHGADLIGDRAHEKAGCDAVAADAEFACFGREGFGNAEDPVLGGGICARIGIGCKGKRRADIDDLAVALLAITFATARLK